MRPIMLLAAACLAACPASSFAQTEISAQPVPLAESLPIEPACSPDRLIVGGDYLMWWLREGRVPAILTTGDPASQGRLGDPSTRIVYGDQRLDTRHDDRFFGGRVNLEWTSSAAGIGVEGRAFFLERDSTYFKTVSNGDTLLALPFTNALTNQPDSLLVAGEDRRRGPLSGGFVGYSRIEWFGEEVNAVLPLSGPEGWRLDLLAGARFLQMRDRFNQTSVSRSLDMTTLYSAMDNFRVGNAFYGGQVGLRGERQWGRCFLQVRGTIALGADDQLVRTFGESIFQTPQVRMVTPSGLFVQPSNSGSWSRCHFDGAGEVGINAGYQVTRHVRVLVGYTFILWADPLRAGDQVDAVVNPRQTGTTSGDRPTVPFKGDTLWAQGVNLGLELCW
jgi:hypothetical protein